MTTERKKLRELTHENALEQAEEILKVLEAHANQGARFWKRERGNGRLLFPISSNEDVEIQIFAMGNLAGSSWSVNVNLETAKAFTWRDAVSVVRIMARIGKIFDELKTRWKID